MKRYIGHLLGAGERRTDAFLRNQVKDGFHPLKGGFKGDIIETKPVVYGVATAVSVYCFEGSRYYHDEELYEGIDRALDFIRRYQREDGSFDYPSCNFKSAPDTAFCFKRLIASYRILARYGTSAGSRLLQSKLEVIMKDAVVAIRDGGFHTPNHRWAIAAALIQGAALFEEEPLKTSLLNRAFAYLAEGIDGNDDGEYAERSTGNYNAVVNNALISIYEETKEMSFLGYVDRNLAMMLYYVDPDDTIFTQNSTRQDRGKPIYMDKYFYQYLYMAVRTGRDVFDHAAHKIMKDNLYRGELAPDCLHILMLYPEMMEYQLRGYGFLTEYHKLFKDSGIYRGKTSKFSYSVIRDSAAFLFIKTGSTQVHFKLGQSYGPIRNFKARELAVEGDTCRLTATARGWYYLPFKEPQGTSDWWQMDHSKREILNSSQLATTVVIRLREDGLEVRVKTEGLDGVPIRLEICVPDKSIIENPHFSLTGEKGKSMILRDGHVHIEHEGECLMIGPGFGSHRFKGHYSGEDLNDETFTICCNDYSPYDRKLTIRCL